jgi:glycosyltransferase involved in cell wall biosynthesis
MFCSIIVPFHNSKKTIKRCLNSAFHQIGDIRYEVILINDFSNDGSDAIVKNFIKHKKNFVLIHSKKKTVGPGYARNLGIKRSIGKYLYFLDSDDSLKKNALKTIFSQVNKNPNIDLICNNYFIEDTIGNFKKKFRFDLKNYFLVKNKIIKNFFYLSIIPQVISNLIKKDLIIKNNLKFEHGFFEDIFFFFRVLYFAKKIEVNFSKIYFKKNRANSIVNSLSKIHITDSFNSYYKCYKFLIKKKSISYQNYFDKIFMIAIVGQVAVFLKRI